MMRFLKAMLSFARYQQWVDEPEWTKDDSVALTRFLAGKTGTKLKASLLNGVLRQQNSACISENNVDRAVGYANGYRGCVCFIETLAVVNTEGKEDE